MLKVNVAIKPKNLAIEESYGFPIDSSKFVKPIKVPSYSCFLMWKREDWMLIRDYLKLYQI